MLIVMITQYGNMSYNSMSAYVYVSCALQLFKLCCNLSNEMLECAAKKKKKYYKKLN